MSFLIRLLLLVCLALTPVAALEVWNQIDLRRHRSVEIHDHARQLLGLLGGEQQRLVEGVRQMLALLAETPEAQSLDAAACQKLLARTRMRLPDYLTINLTNQDGVILCSTDLALPGKTIADRRHVRAALESRGFTVGEFIRQRQSGKPVMPFALPIQGEGANDPPIGVVTALIDLGWLERYLSEHPLPANAALLVTDSDGIVLTHVPERPAAVGSALPDRFRPLLDAKAVGTSKLIGIDGVERVFAYVPLSAGVRHIFVAIGIDHTAAMAGVDDTLYRSLLWIAATLVLGLMATFLIARRHLHRPIKTLVTATERWLGGDRTVRVGAVDGAELSRLGQAFDALVEDLDRQMQAKEAASTALRASEARYRSIVETAVDAMVVIDGRGIVQSYNPAAERIFGYTEADVLGRNVAMLMPEPYRSGHDDYVAAYQRTGDRKIIGIGREVVGCRKDGSIFPLELAIAEWSIDGTRFYTGIMRDISGRQEVEEALRASEERFRALVEDAPHMMWVNRPDGSLEFVNAAFRAYTGRRTTEITRMDDLHPEDVERIQAARARAIAAGEPHEYELRLRRADGTYRWHLSRTHPIRQGGRIVAWFGGAVDIHDIHHARDAAEEAARSKSRFLAAASHDLRQPMQSILLFAEVLRPHLSDEPGLEKLGCLQHSLGILKGLLDGLLDISRLDAGIVAPRFEVFPISDVMRTLDDIYAPLAHRKGLDLQVLPCPASVCSDRVLLGRILRNLVENAVRYTELGRVEIACTVQAERLLIEVHDTGCGIPADQVERVFEELYQIDNPERDRNQGLGLGLAIVRRLSSLLDHPVAVHSQPGQGSTFSVAVPLVMTASNPAPPVEAAVSAPVDENGRRLAVVVDDDPIVLAGMKAILDAWNFEVIAADSTTGAVEHLEHDGRRPDILIVDYRLRDNRIGTEAIVRIRAMYDREIPGVIVTGEIGTEPQNDAIAHGLDLLHKPVTPNSLAGTLGRHLQPVK
ncbi:MAG: PAS domain S-box protein [Alphaproteobacteria bacterium]